MTDYSELEKNRRIRPGKFSDKQISDCLALSKRDLKVSKKMLKENKDWAFNIAYNSMLQAARALMYSKGFRSSGIGQHATIIEFAELSLDKKYSEIIEIMDTIEQEVEIVKQYGSERIFINSSADWGISDPLAVPKTAALMKEQGISDQAIHEVCYLNALEAFGKSGQFNAVDWEMGNGVDQKMQFEGNSILRGGQTPLVEGANGNIIK